MQSRAGSELFSEAALPARRLDVRVLKAWRMNAVLLIALTVAVCTVLLAAIRRFGAFGWEGRVPAWTVLASCGLLAYQVICSLVAFPRVRYATWRYDVTPENLLVWRGVFTKRLTMVPLVRVQFVETQQGPVMARFGLAQVTVTTAGGSVEIPGLSASEAAEFRDRVSELARLAREDDEGDSQ